VQEENLYFQSIKIDRGWYFVEYTPPNASVPFATAQVVAPGDFDASGVAAAMEVELTYWVERYRVPVMVSSFSANGDLISLGAVRPCDHLFGWKSEDTGQSLLHWKLVSSEELPKVTLDPGSLREIYIDIPFRTSADLRDESQKHVQAIRLGWWMLFVWAVIVPAIVAIVEFASPWWLAVLVLAYSLWRSVVQALKLFGIWPKSKREADQEEEQRRMMHHHYHCIRNPEGFARLRSENFERVSREDTQAEVQRLKGIAKYEHDPSVTRDDCPARHSH
jgi:hypothetical protein